MVARFVAQDSLGSNFAALADPTWRAILARLRQGEAPVSVLAEPVEISLPAISRRLKVLQRAGLIARSGDAKWRLCRLDAAPIKGSRRLGGRLSPLLGREVHETRRPAGRITRVNTAILTRGRKDDLEGDDRLPSKQVRDGALETPMERGMNESFDRLDAVLAIVV